MVKIKAMLKADVKATLQQVKIRHKAYIISLLYPTITYPTPIATITLRLHYHYPTPISTTTTTVMEVTFLTNNNNNLNWPNTSTRVVCWCRYEYYQLPLNLTTVGSWPVTIDGRTDEQTDDACNVAYQKKIRCKTYIISLLFLPPCGLKGNCPVATW